MINFLFGLMDFKTTFKLFENETFFNRFFKHIFT